MQGNPQSFPLVADVLCSATPTWPAAIELAERFHKMLPPQLQDQDGQRAVAARRFSR